LLPRRIDGTRKSGLRRQPDCIREDAAFFPIKRALGYELESGGFGGGFGLGGEASALDALEVEALAEE
jgi:hypothetical protein